MTRRQQLILFVLGLATISTCTVGFALTMDLVRDKVVSASAADLSPVAQSATVENVTWNLPPTPVPQLQMPPTPTRPPTPTNTRVPTWTPAPTSTPTATRLPTNTPPPSPTDTPLPTPTSEGPAVTPTPAAPTPTPTPEFPFVATLAVFNTGAPQMTHVTSLVWKDAKTYDGVPGYQMRLVDPNGGIHLSDVSGVGGADSTCADCGDNRRMNMKVEIPGYVPGVYHVILVQGEKQMSPEVTFTLAADPLQYVHVDFIPWK